MLPDHTDKQGTYRQNHKILLPLPSVEITIKPSTNISNTPNNAKQSEVVIPIKQHPLLQQPENNQVNSYTIVRKFFNRKYSIDKKIQGKIFSWMHDFLEIFLPCTYIASNNLCLLTLSR